MELYRKKNNLNGDKKLWTTKGILTSISIKNKYYKTFLKSKNLILVWYDSYNLYRNTLNRLIGRSKINHYRPYFESLKYNSKPRWNGINELISKHSKQATKNINRKSVKDKKIIANEYNDYFSDIAKNLVNKF